MWIRRADYTRVVDELAELRRTHDRMLTLLATDTGKREILTRELAVRQQNVDWLSAHVNRLEAERATLLDRVLHLTFAVPVIARDATDHPELAAAIGVGRPLTPVDREPGDPEGVAVAALAMSSFEDVGDDVAAALGLRHDAAGNLSFQ